jgi:hypothetical protein
MRMMIGALLMTLAMAVPSQAQPAGSTTFKVLLSDRLTTVVQEERISFTQDFTQMTGKKIDVPREGDFDQDISKRIGTIEVATTVALAAAEVTLRARFRLFLADMTVFLLATSPQVVFTVEAVDRYLAAAAKVRRCGEFPCQSGCAEGRPCDYRCNACAPPPGRGRGQ